MPTITAHVKVDLGPLIEFKSELAMGLHATSGNNHIRKAFKQWAARYRGFIQERFDTYSKGGGDWPPLKNKRKRGSKDKASILRDTGTLFAALAPVFQRKPGSIQEDIEYGIRVGYGGPSKHPSGNATIADIASFHQTGAGFLPVRKIIVEPEPHVLVAMAGDMQRAINNMLKGTGNQSKK